MLNYEKKNSSCFADTTKFGSLIEICQNCIRCYLPRGTRLLIKVHNFVRLIKQGSGCKFKLSQTCISILQHMSNVTSTMNEDAEVGKQNNCLFI